MKKHFAILLLAGCLCTLAACDNKNMQSMQQMQRLQILVNQALITAAHGANLKLEGNTHGQNLLKDAGTLLRRALSGPEMAMMHKGKKDMTAGMKQTHDMGDAAFDLLGLMMALTPDTVNAPQLRRLNERLAIAASGNKLLLQSESAGNLKPVMQKHGHQLIHQTEQWFNTIQGSGAYYQLVGRLLRILDSNGQHTPDKN